METAHVIIATVIVLMLWMYHEQIADFLYDAVSNFTTCNEEGFLDRYQLTDLGHL